MKNEVLAGIACGLLMASLATGEIRAYNAAGDEIGGPYGTIQAAIDAMFYAVGDNGRITVESADTPYSGPGNTNIRMWVPMTIQAVDANGLPAELGDVVIDCENSSRAFLFLEGQNIADANRVTTVLPRPAFDDGEAADANDAFIVSGFKVINGFASIDTDPAAIRNRGCGGGMLIDAGYPIIENCMFTECMSEDFAGGGMAIGAGEEGGGGEEVPLIRNCIFYRNIAAIAGGGIAVRLDGAPNIINCLIVNNYADVGGGVYVDECTPNFELCTVAENYFYHYEYGYLSSLYGVYTYEASPTFVNSILWGNPGGDSGEIEASNCVVNEGVGYTAIEGDNVTYRSPMFVSGMYSQIWGELGNYYVAGTSPTIDAGEGTLANPYFRDYGINPMRVTRASEARDRLAVDLGFHYPPYTGPEIDATLVVVVDTDPSWGRVEISAVTDRLGRYRTPPAYDPNGIYSVKLGDTIEFLAVPSPGYRVRIWTGTNDDGILDLEYLYRNTTMETTYAMVRCSFERDLPSTLNYPGQYLDLQYAVNVARHGDTIVVHPGLYRLPASGSFFMGNVYYGAPCVTITQKRITLRSVAPNDPATVASTIIEPGTGFSTVFAVNGCGRDTVISGFTIRNANLTGASGLDGDNDYPYGSSGASEYGAGMMIDGSATVLNCVFENCTVTGGNGGDGTVSDNIGYDGGDGGWAGGGAIYVGHSYRYWAGRYYEVTDRDPLFRNTTFRNCHAIAGDGGSGGQGRDWWGRGGNYRIWTYDLGGSPFDFLLGEQTAGTPIKGMANGGAVYIANGDCDFEDCLFENNYVQAGTTGTGSAPREITDVGSSGGAVYVGDDQNIIRWYYGYDPGYRPLARFTRTRFLNNQTELEILNAESPYLSYGGAIAADNTATLELADCDLMYNKSHFGGAIHWTSYLTLNASTGSVKIEDSRFIANEGLQGGAIYGARGAMSLLNSDFELNTAMVSNAGGEPNSTAGGNLLTQGGAIYLIGVDSLIGDSRFSLNQATHSGGALCLAGNNDPLAVTIPRIHNCLFVSNKADRDGGAVVLSDGSEPNVVNCTIVNNTATGDGFAVGSGGGLSVTTGSRVQIENSLLWGNSAPTGRQMSLADPNGGGAYQPSYATVRNSMVQGAEGGIATAPGSYLIYLTSNVQSGEPGFVYNYVSQTPLFISDYSLGDTSPCVDAGSIDLESPIAGIQPLLPLGRYAYTLRTDGLRDAGIIDIGYHRRKAGQYPQGDVDYSGTVTMQDLAVMMEYWLADYCRYPDWCEGTDLDQSGLVNLPDTALLSQFYGAGDITAPLPNPAQWLIPPTASSTTSITMTAVTGLDNSGNPVEYFFEAVSAGGHSSAWQGSSAYSDTGLTTGLEYGYRVKVRDVIPDDPDRHNETAWSSTLYGYAGEDGRAPNPNPSEWATPPYATSATSIAMTAMTAVDASGVEYYFRCESGHNGYDSGWQASPSFINIGLTPGTQYTYTVRTRDKSPARNTGGLSVARSATTFQLPDTTPPTPLQAQWLIRPYGLGDSMISMAAVIATDPSGVEYFFECISGGHEHDSGWQQSNLYMATGLQPGSAYTFIAKVRDRSVNRNACTDSIAVTAYTLGTGGTGIGLPPFPDPMMFSVTSAWDGAETGLPTQVIAYETLDVLMYSPPGYYHVMTAFPAVDATGSSLGVEYYFQCVTYPKISSGWVSVLPLAEGEVGGAFYYARVGDLGWPKKYVWRVKARDMWGVETGWSQAYVAGGN